MLLVVAPGWTKRVLEEIERKVNSSVNTSNDTDADIDDGTKNSDGGRINKSDSHGDV